MVSSKRLTNNFIWNTFGTTLYFLTQWILMIAVVRISGDYEDAGLLTQCMTIGNVAVLIANYNIRQYQVSDINDRFTQAEYFSHRVINSAVAITIVAVFCYCAGYDMRTGTVVTAYILFKVTEAVADVFHGIVQRNERMDYIGKSLAVKGMLAFAVFIALYSYFGDLLKAIAGMFAVSALTTTLYDYRKAKLFSEVLARFDRKKYLSMLAACFPIFIYGLSMSVIPALPRLYLESSHGRETLGLYASAATPAVIVQVCISYIFLPLMTTFSKCYADRDRKLIRVFLIVLLLIAITGIAATAASYYFGEWILALLFGSAIVEYAGVFVTAIICSLCLGLCWFLFMLLIVMRRTATIVAGSIIGVLAGAVCTMVGVPLYGIDGVNHVLILTYLAMCAIASTTLVPALKRIARGGR